MGEKEGPGGGGFYGRGRFCTQASPSRRYEMGCGLGRDGAGIFLHACVPFFFVQTRACAVRDDSTCHTCLAQKLVLCSFFSSHGEKNPVF